MSFAATVVIHDSHGTPLYQTEIPLNPRGYYWKDPAAIFNGRFLELRLVDKATRGSTGQLGPIPEIPLPGRIGDKPGEYSIVKNEEEPEFVPTNWEPKKVQRKKPVKGEKPLVPVKSRRGSSKGRRRDK